MTEYSMPVLSEQERKDLIGLARIEVKRWEIADGKQYMVELMNIALAALTAKPVGMFMRGVEVEPVPGRIGYSDMHGEDASSPLCLPLYAAPPVPVIKQEGEQRD